MEKMRIIYVSPGGAIRAAEKAAQEQPNREKEALARARQWFGREFSRHYSWGHRCLCPNCVKGAQGLRSIKYEE